MFGQSTFGSNTTFGANQNKPAFGGFGSTATSQPNTSFGGGLFGQQQQQQQTTSSGGLFGTSTSTFGQTGNTFGQPTNTFGQANNTFGQNANTSFGASSAFKPTGFGTTTQSNTGGGLFGSSTTTQSGGLFGSNNPTSSFGSSAFGQNSGTTSAFGQPNTFGGGSFGAATVTQDGTGHTKFQPTNGTDTMMKSGQQSSINTRHLCITCMKEYENKSLEELRCEDYIANRKGGTGGAAGGMGGGLFGQSSTPASGGLFGATTSSGGLFGQQQQQQNKPMFGTSGFGGNTTSAAPAFGFGQAQTSQAGGGGLFGASKPLGFGNTPVASVAPAFGSNTGFGSNTATSTGGGLFGSSTPAPAFGSTTGSFGANTSQPGGLFGSTSQPSAFGATTNTTSGFGGFGTQQQQQPNQNIGLFGANQNKPAFGGFGAAPAASTAPSAFGTTGGFGASTSQAGGLFGANNANKPTGFGGFGATATSQPSTSFGGFGQNTGGGLFGANNQANKPAAFSFGSTAPAAAPTQSFGGFGSNTGGSLFGNNQAKPGGLFGGTNTFGSTNTGTGGFGGFGTSNTTGFGGGGGGLNFGGATNTAVAAAAAPAANTSIHQQLLSLASSPFGENPLFKPLATDANKRADILKPTNPAAQKALLANTIKASPHRNVKMRVKPNSSSDKSQIFEGLDDDLLSTGDMFVPRPSVKKLVLRGSGDVTSSSQTAAAGQLGAASPAALITESQSADNSLTVGLHDNLPIRSNSNKKPSEVNNDTIPVDDSFAALHTRKKTIPEDDTNSPVTSRSANKPGCAGVTLERAGYYTIPAVSHLSLDQDDKCLVTGFTVGREGYGNIHFPGTINIANINLDDIVHIRHKEVIVYPDDNNKPALGDGLNRPAQITLDKVWPVDKSNGDAIRSPDRLKKMSYEEKLERASTRLGAKFVEYRPETGSWVFKVEHFSKYGLIDDSDDEVEVTPMDNKKAKTLEKRTEPANIIPIQQIPQNTMNFDVDNINNKNSMMSAVDNNISCNKVLYSNNASPSASDDDGSDKDVEMDMMPAYEKTKTAARSALFGDESEPVVSSVTKPVILQHRVTSMAAISVQPRIIECIANSVLGPAPPSANVSRGLGGMSTLGGSTTLQSSYLESSTILPEQSSMSMSMMSVPRTKTSKLASYSLQGGYDKWVSLPGQTRKQSDQMTVFVPQHVDTELDIGNSYLGRAGRWVMMDSGLMMNKSNRVGWGRDLDIVTVGDQVSARQGRCIGNVTMSTVNQTSTGQLEPAQVDSLRDWFQVALDTSVLIRDPNDGTGAMFVPVNSIDTLHTHQVESYKQLDNMDQASLEWNNWVKMYSQIWSLMVALWGRVEDVTGEETLETHDLAMTRRDAVSKWLESVVGDKAKRDLDTAAQNKNVVAGVVARLSGGDVSEACRTLQEAGDHRSALLAAQSGGGGVSSRMCSQQLERWTEVKCDKNINKDRLKLYSIIAGVPVWGSSSGPVNTCSELDWIRSLACHLWYLTHPLSSIPDALHQFELAWRGTGPSGPYCTGPAPDYIQSTVIGQQIQIQDIRYLLLRLYCDRSTRMESVCDPSSHTSDMLDIRMGWFVFRVLEMLGYRHMSHTARERIHRDMACQAEAAGLWVWSVFVLQHLQTAEKRKAAVRATIDRNIEKCDETTEEFLVTKLAVPAEWIAASRATLAKSENDLKMMVENLIAAGKWSEAHDALIKNIVPDAIISQDYDYIHGLLEKLSSTEISQQISGWTCEGSVYLQYIEIESAVTKLLQASHHDDESLQYQLEKLRPAVSRLCRAVSTIPANTPKDRLAQSEIAKKVAHLMRVVHSSVGVNSNSARQLAELLSSLPLPEDYALQELRSLTRSYMMEIA